MEGTNNASSTPGGRGNAAASPEGKGKNDCPRSIEVTLIIRNEIQPVYFEYRQRVTKPPGTPLIRYLEAAADQDAHFKFNATYFPSPFGYFIESFNGLRAIWNPDKTSWTIFGDGKMLDLGVSSYFPDDGEVITFDYRNNK